MNLTIGILKIYCNNWFVDIFRSRHFVCLNDHTYLYTADYSFIIFRVIIIIITMYNFWKRTLLKCYFVLQFSGQKKFRRKVKSIFSINLARAITYLYNNTRHISCVYNYEATCGKRFNINIVYKIERRKQGKDFPFAQRLLNSRNHFWFIYGGWSRR